MLASRGETSCDGWKEKTISMGPVVACLCHCRTTELFAIIIHAWLLCCLKPDRSAVPVTSCSTVAEGVVLSLPSSVNMCICRLSSIALAGLLERLKSESNT